jgi:hypothetical protein
MAKSMLMQAKSLEEDFQQDFPVEILLEIITYLEHPRDIYTFSRVNWTWQSVAQERLWNGVQLTHSGGVKRLAQIMRQAHSPKRKSSISILPLRKLFRYSSKNDLKKVEKSIRSSQKTLVDESLILLPWHRTRRLDLGELSVKYFYIKPIKWKISYIVSQFAQLKSLVLPPCRLWTPCKIFESLPLLEDLDLSKSLGGPDGFFESILIALAHHCKRLKTISFGSSLCLDPSIIHGESLLELGRACHLTRFKLRIRDSQPHLHSSVLTSIFRSNKSFEKVHLENLCCLDYRYLFYTLKVLGRVLTYICLHFF